MSIRWFRVVALTALTSLTTRQSLAQNPSDDERARTHFEAGRSYFEEGDCDHALDEFQRAYALSRRTMLLVNIANCQERLGMWADAAGSLDTYMSSLPTGDSQRPNLERRIANLRQRAAARVTVEPQPGATAESQVPTTGEPEASQTSEALSPQMQSPPAPGSDGLLVPSIVLFAVGGAALITWGVLGGLAMAEDSRIANGCGASRSCASADVQPMKDLALGADVALGLGIAAAVAGAVMILVDPPREGSTSVAGLSPRVSEREAGVVVHGSF